MQTQKQKVAEILVRNVNQIVPVYKVLNYSGAYRYGEHIRKLRKEGYDIWNIKFYSRTKKKMVSFYILCTDPDVCAKEVEKIRHKFL